MNPTEVRAALLRIATADVDAFTGPTGMVSDVFCVHPDEGMELIDVLSACDREPIPLPSVLAPAGVTLVHFQDTDALGEVGAFIDDDCVGVYAGSCLYVKPSHQGRGVGTALALAAAVVRGGSVIGDWGMHGYCAAGLAAHERAFERACDWAHQRLLGRDGEPMALYHGSPDLPARPAFGRPVNAEPKIHPGRAFFVTNEPDYARRFARRGHVQPLQARLSNPINLDDPAVLADLLERLKELPDHEDTLMLMGDPETPEEAIGSAYFMLEEPAIMQYLMDQGYDGAVMAEDINRQITSFALFFPDQAVLPPQEPARRRPANDSDEPSP